MLHLALSPCCSYVTAGAAYDIEYTTERYQTMLLDMLEAHLLFKTKHFCIMCKLGKF